MKTHPILFSIPMVQSIIAYRKLLTRRTQGLEGINLSPDDWIIDGVRINSHFIFHNKDKNATYTVKPKYLEGDILWVRETWQNLDTQEIWGETEDEEIIYQVCYTYKASNDLRPNGVSAEDWCGNWVNVTEKMYEDANDRIETEEVEGRDIWYPSIHMPKAAARIFLKVINVRCERLRDITEEDAEAEGVEKFHHGYTGSPRGIWYRDYLYGGGYDQENARKSFLGLWESINGKESVKKNPWVFIYEFEKTEKPENFLNK